MQEHDHPGALEPQNTGKSQKPDNNILSRRITAAEKLTLILSAVVAFTSVVQFFGYITGERAVLFAEVLTLPQELGDVDPLPIRLEIKNGGKALATIKEVSSAIAHELPSNPRKIKATKFAFPPAVAGGSVKRTLKFPVTGGYTGETLAALKKGSRKLYVFGVIRYADWATFPIFGYKETGFCFVYAPARGEDGFETCDNPAYSYAR